MKRFRQYVPWSSDAYLKPSNVGRKSRQDQQIRSGQSEEPDTVIGRHEINVASDANGGSQPSNFLAEEIRFFDSRV